MLQRVMDLINMYVIQLLYCCQIVDYNDSHFASKTLEDAEVQADIKHFPLNNLNKAGKPHSLSEDKEFANSYASPS